MTTTAVRREVLQPAGHHRWRSAVVVPVAAALPTCVATVWLAVHGGHLLTALVLIGLLLVAGTLLAAGVLRIRVELLPDGLLTTGIVGRTRRVERSRVKRAVIRTLAGTDGIRTVRHLFLLDEDDRTVVRMSTRWWTPADLDRVARFLEVPLETPTEVVHLGDLRRSVPAQLSWAERHPGLARAIMLLSGFAGCLVVGALAAASL